MEKEKLSADREDILNIISRMIREGKDKEINILNELKYKIQIRDKNLKAKLKK